MHATLGQVIMFGFDSDENTDSLSSLCPICPKTKILGQEIRVESVWFLNSRCEASGGRGPLWGC